MKLVVALSLFLTLSCVSAYTSNEYQYSFTLWMHEYGKMYTTEEFVERFEIFKVNMDYIRDWNAKNSSTVLGLNIFADLSNSEYCSIYLGTRIDASTRLANPEPWVAPESFGPLAVNIDWRDKKVVTPIKDQGQCGSCWSFSTTGSIEGAWALSTGKLVSLSEQNLMDCSIAHGNLGCNGGDMGRAMDYVVKNNGIDTEESYPYTAKLGVCHFSVANVGASISSHKSIATGSESALAAALNTQPVSVAIDASHNSFQLYKSGVYYESACSSTRLDHGVLAIGYGTSGVDDYWIVKNSWGTSWGMEGYIQMARNKNNNCGIATQASVPAI